MASTFYKTEIPPALKSTAVGCFLVICKMIVVSIFCHSYVKGKDSWPEPQWLNSAAIGDSLVSLCEYSWKKLLRCVASDVEVGVSSSVCVRNGDKKCMLWWCLMLEMTEIFNFQPASTWTISRSQWDQLRKVRVSGAGRPAGACKYNPTLLDVSRVWPVCKMDSLCFFPPMGWKEFDYKGPVRNFLGAVAYLHENCSCKAIAQIAQHLSLYSRWFKVSAYLASIIFLGGPISQ